MLSTGYDPKFQSLFSIKGGRVGSKRKNVASRNGKYTKPKSSYSDKNSYKPKTDTPKELTKAHWKLSSEIKKIDDEIYFMEVQLDDFFWEEYMRGIARRREDEDEEL